MSGNRVDGPWITHGENRMHLPELSGTCVHCLHEALTNLFDAANGFMLDTDYRPHSLNLATGAARKVLDTFPPLP